MSNPAHTVAIFSAHYPPAFLGGGPIRTLSAMIKATPENFIPIVVSSDTDLGEKTPLPVVRNAWTHHDGNAVFYTSPTKLKYLINALQATREMNPDIVYLSSFFNFRFSIIPQLLCRIHFLTPQLIALAPRGEFGFDAMKLKKSKKLIYIWIYRHTKIGSSVIWHASSAREASDIRRVIGGKLNIVIRENDTDLPEKAIPPIPSQRDTLRAFFVGRIVRIKGLDILLEALRQCPVPIDFDIYGPEEDASYSLECKRLAMELPPNIKVRFMGAIPNDRLRAILPKYDLMTFPTLGENFGHVIAESLSASCPVMCADVTPWTTRIREGGGVILAEHTPVAWATAIQEFAGLTPEERLTARQAAGDCFNSWRRNSKAEHLFSMLMPRP